MGAVAGLLAGLGLVLVRLALTTPPPQWRSERSRRLGDLLVQAGAGGTSPAAFLAGTAVLGLVVALVFLGVSKAWTIAVAFGVLATGLPYLLLSGRARARRTRLREAWPEAVDTLVSGVRAGMSLPEALGALAERGPEAVRTPFAAFAADYAATARFGASLDRLKDRFADPVADRIIEALRLAQEVGGAELGALLRALSRMLREDLRTRGELRARQSWTVNGARVAVAAPWLVLALLSTRPQAAQAYATTAGGLVLLVGALASAIAYRLMLRLGRLPEEERVLR
ncbi:type II secretion system protein F [Actinomyces sp. oral taxon 414]|uniref:type II secretion system F family protein n=1 Tax=Actinomyces sp. oral taxon 414 TaxID=712122 RepID=UPI0006AFC834|nr:type II secretion system F family protein [Actinomyces sp. oral taxon 414]ALC98715.1 type II secretion system protein F [Actinomyces sp. oral taxon 414]